MAPGWANGSWPDNVCVRLPMWYDVHLNEHHPRDMGIQTLSGLFQLVNWYRVIFFQSFPLSFCSWLVSLFDHPCLVSILVTGPSPTWNEFLHKIFTWFLLFLRGLKNRKWRISKNDHFVTAKTRTVQFKCPWDIQTLSYMKWTFE